VGHHLIDDRQKALHLKATPLSSAHARLTLDSALEEDVFWWRRGRDVALWQIYSGQYRSPTIPECQLRRSDNC